MIIHDIRGGGGGGLVIVFPTVDFEHITLDLLQCTFVCTLWLHFMLAIFPILLDASSWLCHCGGWFWWKRLYRGVHLSFTYWILDGFLSVFMTYLGLCVLTFLLCYFWQSLFPFCCKDLDVILEVVLLENGYRNVYTSLMNRILNIYLSVCSCFCEVSVFTFWLWNAHVVSLPGLLSEEPGVTVRGLDSDWGYRMTFKCVFLP